MVMLYAGLMKQRYGSNLYIKQNSPLTIIAPKEQNNFFEENPINLLTLNYIPSVYKSSTLHDFSL